MLTLCKYLKHGVIFLAFAVLSLGGGGRANLCLQSDGEVHLEQSHSSCNLGGEEGDSDQRAYQGGCLDITLGGDRLPLNNLQLPLPALSLLPLGVPCIFPLIDQEEPRHTLPPTPPTQLVSLKSVVLLI